MKLHEMITIIYEEKSQEGFKEKELKFGAGKAFIPPKDYHVKSGKPFFIRYELNIPKKVNRTTSKSGHYMILSWTENGGTTVAVYDNDDKKNPISVNQYADQKAADRDIEDWFKS